jgi:hypothetical protein
LNQLHRGAGSGARFRAGDAPGVVSPRHDVPERGLPSWYFRDAHEVERRFRRRIIVVVTKIEK